MTANDIIPGAARQAVFPSDRRQEVPRQNEVSAAEAGRRLGIDKATAARWLQAGKMHGTRTAGGHWRVRLEEIERLREESAGMSADAISSSLAQALAHLGAVEAGASDPELRRLARRALVAAEHAARRAAHLGI